MEIRLISGVTGILAMVAWAWCGLELLGPEHLPTREIVLSILSLHLIALWCVWAYRHERSDGYELREVVDYAYFFFSVRSSL